VSTRDDLIDLERGAWEALSTSGEAASKFYADVLATDVLVLLPGGLVVDDRDQVIASMQQADWTSFELTDERVLELSPDSAILAYRVDAQRGGDADADYHALLGSTYVRENGAWKLAVHQQTPL
jgi:hypothetical protein